VIAAIYARKSTKDAKDQVREDDAKSVTRQTDSARVFIEKQGWSLDASNIYVDDGKSGMLFTQRPSFQRMMRDAAAGLFEVVVFFDLDRFGRHAQKSMEALGTLAETGVEIYDCSNGQRIDLDSFEGELNASVQTQLAQYLSAKIRKHTKAAMWEKAKKGWHTHGKVFGYDVDRIAKGHCELRINGPEAEVVRDIYRRFAAGDGARTIAGWLNRSKVLKPRAQQGRRDGWSVSTIRAVLSRPLYRGEIVYGRTAKAYNRELRKVYRHTKREKGQIPKPQEGWVRVQAPHLRIIDAELAEKVDARLTDRRVRYKQSLKTGHHPDKAAGRYLLSGGMLLCPTCGGHFEARKYPWRGKGAHPVYMCATRRRKPGVCSNTLALPIEATDDEVLSIVEEEVLCTDFIKELLSLVKDAPDETAWMTAERDRLQVEHDRLIASIAAGVPADSVASLVQEKAETISRLERKLLVPRPKRLDHERLRAALERRSTEWKRDLRNEPSVARIVLRRLVGPLTLWNEAERPDFVEWKANPKMDLLDGLAPTLMWRAQAFPLGTNFACFLNRCGTCRKLASRPRRGRSARPIPASSSLPRCTRTSRGVGVADVLRHRGLDRREDRRVRVSRSFACHRGGGVAS
jgi:site-specific DNA recombinase